MFFTVLIVFLFIDYSFEQKCNNRERTHTWNAEQRLICDLLDNYQVKWGRPVRNMTEDVEVRFGLQLIHISDLDEKNQVLITNQWQNYEWDDEALTWDPEDYDNLMDIRLPIKRIWQPDVTLYNYADTRLEEKREVLATVYHNGTVFWKPMSIFKSTCQIDIRRFPYDRQNCSMKFGSWTYDSSKVNLRFYRDIEKFDLNAYVKSNEWSIIGNYANRNVERYDCCPEIYVDLKFHIQLERRGGFYNYILILPCVLLSCLTCILFWLPPESPSKLVLGMNIFTSFFVLLLLLYKNMPSNAEHIPRIGAYYCLNMGMIATSTFLCTIVVHIYFRGAGPMPAVLRKVFLEWLARFFHMVPHTNAYQQHAVNGLMAPIKATCDGDKFEKFELLKERFKSFGDKRTMPGANDESAEVLEMMNDHSYHQHPHQFQQNQESSLTQQIQQQISASITFMTVETDLKEIRDFLRTTRKRMENKEAKTKTVNDWKQVALVLDRTFFFIYLTAIIISLAVMFPR
ncbi:unnamed protein product [Rotaria socialis]|uniref:Uncharacterized protein n=1 Tax=Rotaria socialis TaxID=392032 RepID=A0A818NLS4_9BILA|nr:unnamed protein product [Rotaria socialis]CAF3331654.1 unnamed protein product [Rotaria socialis]CAF3463309.1 unnamed protein product [Rotaria socialis]CAF3609092.1 unnamed protein product [Rotaria socialis]CAF3660159.1 unnamed protein product [Rotaria socialis]